jgi:hypothetical protein
MGVRGPPVIQSALIGVAASPALTASWNMVTLVHFSIFSAMKLANSFGEFGSTATTPRLAKPLLDVRIEHRRVGLFVERRDGV